MSDRKIEDLQDAYQQIEIPQELSFIVGGTIDKVNREMNRKKKGYIMIKRIGSVAAVAVFVMLAGFSIGINTSPAFAATVSEIPVLSQLAKIFTAEEIHEENDAYVADLKIPGIEGLEDKELQQEINSLVQRQIDAAVSEATALMEEDKKAWLAAGGKESDYNPRHIEVDYEINCLTEDIISFTVFKTETGASGYFDLYYYNYDLKAGKQLSLADLLGMDYKESANAQILNEIEERAKEKDASFFDGSNGAEGFKTISDQQQFYVNEAGNPVIVFNKYEIAPGYMGIQEFEITRQADFEN